MRTFQMNTNKNILSKKMLENFGISDIANRGVFMKKKERRKIESCIRWETKDSAKYTFGRTTSKIKSAKKWKRNVFKKMEKVV